MWQPGCHPRGGRRAQVHLVSVDAGRNGRSLIISLQFDPAPRAGEPLVSRRPPDYVSCCGRDGLSLTISSCNRALAFVSTPLASIQILHLGQCSHSPSTILHYRLGPWHVDDSDRQGVKGLRERRTGTVQSVFPMTGKQNHRNRIADTPSRRQKMYSMRPTGGMVRWQDRVE